MILSFYNRYSKGSGYICRNYILQPHTSTSYCNYIGILKLRFCYKWQNLRNISKDLKRPFSPETKMCQYGIKTIQKRFINYQALSKNILMANAKQNMNLTKILAGKEVKTFQVFLKIIRKLSHARSFTGFNLMAKTMRKKNVKNQMFSKKKLEFNL